MILNKLASNQVKPRAVNLQALLHFHTQAQPPVLLTALSTHSTHPIPMLDLRAPSAARQNQYTSSARDGELCFLGIRDILKGIRA